MKRFVILILALLCVPCFGQTVINRSGAIHGEPYVSPYDSLSNFHKFKHDDHEDYYHLVGQTALYIGEPYSGKTNPSLSVGSEYKIIDVLPDEKWNSALCYLKVKNTKTGKIIRVEPGLLDILTSAGSSKVIWRNSTLFIQKVNTPAWVATPILIPMPIT